MHGIIKQEETVSLFSWNVVAGILIIDYVTESISSNCSDVILVKKKKEILMYQLLLSA